MKINNFHFRTGWAARFDISPGIFHKGACLFARGIFFLVLLVSASGLNLQRAAAGDLPGGFYLVEEQPGVRLYRKEYRDGTPDFVLTVDLSTGASVDLLHGRTSENDGKKAASQFAGPNPAFSEAPIGGYWQAYAQEQPGAFCVLNGQFFYMQESPTPLALPLKTGGNILSEGFGYPQYPEKQLMLALWGDRADILPLTQENLYGTDAPDVLGGLDPQANKKPKNAVGRTFMGILDGNGDGTFETILILATQTATQAAADKTLRSFGAAKVMMLDGGGSTQLVCNGRAFIDTTRVLPQAIGVAASIHGTNGAGAGLEAQLAAPASGDQSAAAQAAVAATSQENVSAPLPSQDSQTPIADQQQPQALPESTAAIVSADGSTTVEADTVGAASAEVSSTEANPESQAGIVDQVNGGDPQTGLANDLPLNSPDVSRLSRLAGSLPGSTTQNQAGFIPPSAYRLNTSSASDVGGFNAGDVLWLPALIPPLSIIILFAVRRRNRPAEW